MAIEKRTSSDSGKVTVTFRVPADAGAHAAELVGEFTEWTPVAMTPGGGGDHVVAVDLDAGASYRFRYRLDGDRWINDWAADGYVPNNYGSEDSVVDLTRFESLPEAEPASKPKRPRAPRKAAAGASAEKITSKAEKADAAVTKPKRAPGESRAHRPSDEAQ